MESTTPPSNTSVSPGDKKFNLGFVEHARRLLISIRGRKKRNEDMAAAERGGKLPSELAGSEPAQAVIRAFYEVELTRYAGRLLTASTVIGAVVLIVIFIGTMYASSRPKVTIAAAVPLEEAIEQHLEGQSKADYARLVLYLRSTIEPLNQIDPEENTLREAIKPLLHLNVWNQKSAERAQLASAYSRLGITQNCTIKSVSGIVVNEEDRRIRCYIRGFYSLLVLAPPAEKTERGGVSPPPQPKSRTLPYRAEVVLEVGSPSQINPYEFFMVSLVEKTGASAVEWDRQQKE